MANGRQWEIRLQEQGDQSSDATQQEELAVGRSNATVQPDAVVVQLRNARLTERAIVDTVSGQYRIIGGRRSRND